MRCEISRNSELAQCSDVYHDAHCDTLCHQRHQVIYHVDLPTLNRLDFESTSCAQSLRRRCSSPPWEPAEIISQIESFHFLCSRITQGFEGSMTAYVTTSIVDFIYLPYYVCADKQEEQLSDKERSGFRAKTNFLSTFQVFIKAAKHIGLWIIISGRIVCPFY